MAYRRMSESGRESCAMTPDRPGESPSQRDALGAKGKQTSLVAQGKTIFRFDTFGDEAKWTDALKMHEVISA